MTGPASLELSHSNHNGVLHIKTRGALNRPENLHVWEQVQSISNEHQAKRVLIECDPTSSHISMEHCFELIEKIPLISRCLACKIALFEHQISGEMHELLKFVETAVTDRGAHFKLFQELEEARHWLKNRPATSFSEIPQLDSDES